MLLSTSFPLAPNNFCVTSSSSFDHPPRTSVMILCCSTTYPLNCCLSRHVMCPYFRVFSASLRVRFSIHGQYISSVVTFLALWYMIRASTVGPYLSLYRVYWYIPECLGISALYVGFGSTGEYQGSTFSQW